MTHAARAVGVLVAEAHFIAGGLLHLDHRPVGFQFIGHHHGQAGAHALAHLRAVADNGHRAIGGDTHIDFRIVDPTVGHAVGAELFLFVLGKSVLPAPARRQYQRTGGTHPFQEATATELAQIAQGEIIR
ncbi:hypothetical protein D3C81_1149850 [compost metagenome]